MPSRGSALAVAVASTTVSPILTTAAPWACLANFPVSKERRFPPASSTDTSTGCGFMVSFPYGQEGRASAVRGGTADEPVTFASFAICNLQDLQSQRRRKTRRNADPQGIKAALIVD